MFIAINTNIYNNIVININNLSTPRVRVGVTIHLYSQLYCAYTSFSSAH